LNLKDCFKEELLRPFKFDRSVIEKEISNSKRHLTNAQKCIEDKMYDLAVVSIYTSMFHAARAILYRDGFKERSHICLIEYIGENYPKLNDFLKVLDAYRESRHEMLYGLDVSAMKEDAIYGIDVAKNFIEAVRKEVE